MKHRFRPAIFIGGAMGLLLLGMVSAAWAATPAATYDLSWSTIDGGGGASSGGAYSLNGTIGQADAGALSGGVYVLSGGFWAGASFDYRTYLPLALKLAP